MLEHVQIIEEQGQAKFAVIDFEEYLSIKALLTEPDKLGRLSGLLTHASD